MANFSIKNVNLYVHEAIQNVNSINAPVSEKRMANSHGLWRGASLHGNDVEIKSFWRIFWWWYVYVWERHATHYGIPSVVLQLARLELLLSLSKPSNNYWSLWLIAAVRIYGWNVTDQRTFIKPTSNCQPSRRTMSCDCFERLYDFICECSVVFSALWSSHLVCMRIAC